MPEDFIIAIRLTGVKPRVSRQVQVSSKLGLHRFHQVIQAVMGWEDAVPHLWRGLYDDFGDLRQFVPPGPVDERKATVTNLFNLIGDTATYLYDFDAQWTHELLLVDFTEQNPSPILLDGSGACPPEGILGAHAYEQFKHALKDRSHPLWRVDHALMSSFNGFNAKQFSRAEAAGRLEQLRPTWRKRSQPKRTVRSRSLVVIENAPIRRRYRQELDQARAKRHQLELELERFKGGDTNAFKSWLHASFPVQLSRIRELHEEASRLVNRLNLMREFLKHGVKAPGAAYQRAIRVETGDDPMPDFPPPSAAERSHESERESEFLRTAMQDLAEDMGLDPDLIEEELDAMFEDVGSATAAPSRQECQSIYRKIALRLHPDRGGTMNEAEAQIWYRAQEAYAAGDVLTLRQLWSRVADQTNSNSELSCGDMIAAAMETEAQIAALLALRESLKREPAWNFSRLSKKQLRSRQTRVEKDLAKQEGSIREELEDLQAQCQRFSALQQRWETKHRGSVEQMNLF
jgi:hypothetical protein